MKKIFVLLAACFISLVPLYASRFDAIQLEKISRSRQFLQSSQKLREYIPYLDTEAGDWYYPVPREDVSGTVNYLLKQTDSVRKRQPRNYEAALFSALLTSYRYALGEASVESVCASYDSIKEKFRDEYRTSWFYGMFLCGVQKVSDGAREFLSCVPDEKVIHVSSDYLTDKATVFQMCGCIKNAFLTYEASAAMQDKCPDELFPLYSVKKNHQLPPSALDGTYEPRGTWMFSRIDEGTFRVVSYIAGYSAVIHGSWNWNLSNIGYKNRMVCSAIQFPVPAGKDRASGSGTLLTLTMYFPFTDSWQNSDEFIAQELKGVNFKKGSMEINGNVWTTYEVQDAKSYSEQGGFHGLMLVLDRPAPGNSWSKTDMPFTDVTDNRSMFLVQDRIDAPYTLFVMLDSSEELYGAAYEVLMDYMNNMAVQ